MGWNYQLFIDGAWTQGAADEAITVIDPATEETIGEVPEATLADARDAIAAARKAFDEGPWPYLNPAERGRVLERMADALQARHEELRKLIVAETGTAGFITDAIQCGGAIGIGHYNAREVQRLVEWVEASPPTGGPNGMGGSALVREPVGVVAAITPFNFPFMLNMVKVFPALAVGCSVVLKPHPWTPLDAFEIARAAEEAELPPGVLNVITGHVEVGDELTGNPLVDMITFTGSTATGRRIMSRAGEQIKRVQLELGRKSAQVILGDVPEAVVRSIGFGAVLVHCGQGCALQTRLLMPEHLMDAYLDGVKAAAAHVVVGDPRDLATVRAGRGGHARHRRQGAGASEERLLLRAHRAGRPQRDAHRAGGDLRPGADGDSVLGQGRRCGAYRQRFHLRLERRDDGGQYRPCLQRGATHPHRHHHRGRPGAGLG